MELLKTLRENLLRKKPHKIQNKKSKRKLTKYPIQNPISKNIKPSKDKFSYKKNSLKLENPQKEIGKTRSETSSSEKAELQFSTSASPDNELNTDPDGSCDKTVIDFSYGCINDHEVTILADGLCQNTEIKYLYLGNNEIGNKGAMSLANCIHKNKSLLVLSLENNRIGNEGCRSLADALCHNDTLMYLYLRGNSMGSIGFKSLANTILYHNTSLSLVDLEGTKSFIMDNFWLDVKYELVSKRSVLY